MPFKVTIFFEVGELKKKRLLLIRRDLGKRYYVAPSFEDVPQSQQFRIRYMRYLINECVLNAKFVESPEEADVIFRGDQDKT